MNRPALIILLLLSGFAARAQRPFTRVKDLMHNGDFSPALVTLDSCILKNYHKDSALYYKSMVYLKKGGVKYAKDIAHTLTKTYPDFKEVHYLNGLIQYSDENFGKSIDEFGLAIRANPNHIKALYNRSLAFGMLEDYLNAIDDLGACIALNPNYALAYYSRGYWYEFTGNYIEAAKDYENSIRLDPMNYDAYYGLAYVYQMQKETSRACEVINMAIREGSQIAEELKSNFCK